MQTNISDLYQNNPHINEAERILRSCVHCGFCAATCPTYQLLGDELDSPRGRIYLIKEMLEGNKVSQSTQLHLDRCLTCRSCETTCPSGVKYGKLIDIGRELVEQQVKRSFIVNTQRYLLRKILPFPNRFSLLLKAANIVKPILPTRLKKKLPAIQITNIKITKKTLARKMLILEGCVQSVTTPRTNIAVRNILQKRDIELISATKAGCCGAVSHHLSASDEALVFVRKNIDAWWPYVEQGVEAIVLTASGCGVMIKEYGDLLAHDASYASKAKKISDLAHDISEIIENENIDFGNVKNPYSKIAFHNPCTLQHGQQLVGVVENILLNAGFNLTHINDAHLCCGSAGTYSILQAKLSSQLLDNKLAELQANNPDVIVTANIGCQSHLATQAKIPVKHWVELLNEVL